MGDLNRRRGQIQGMETRGNVCVIDANVPLENMLDIPQTDHFHQDEQTIRYPIPFRTSTAKSCTRHC